MKALVYQEGNKLKLQDIPDPQIEKPTDAIIKVTLSAICGGDLQIREMGLQEPGKAVRLDRLAKNKSRLWFCGQRRSHQPEQRIG